MFVHDQVPPGVSVMKDKRAEISYNFDELPTSGWVLIKTVNADALKAIHHSAWSRLGHRRGWGTGSSAGKWICPRIHRLHRYRLNCLRFRPSTLGTKPSSLQGQVNGQIQAAYAERGRYDELGTRNTRTPGAIFDIMSITVIHPNLQPVHS